MNLYIEKEFLFDFALGYDESSSSNAARRLFNFISFPEMERFIDVEITPENLEDFEYCFAKTKISTIKFPVEKNFEKFVEQQDSLSCSVFLLGKETIWIDHAAEKGALCFTLSDYERKVDALINHVHFKIDLSEPFIGWSLFTQLTSFTSSKLFITDNYLLVDKSSQRIDHNCGLLFKSILSTSKEYELSVFTRKLDEPANATPQEIVEIAIKKRGKLHSILSNYHVNINLTNNGLRDSSFFHDRILLTDYYLLESTKGFNLMPWTASNAQIICESIFEKFTYKRIKNLRKRFDAYSLSITKLETNGFKTIG
jgi:hypothetical protein